MPGLAQLVLDIEQVDQHQHDHGDRRRQEHAEDAEEDAASGDGADGDHRRQIDHPLLQQRGDEVSLHLLDDQIEPGDPQRILRRLGECDQQRRNRRQEGADQRDELQKPGHHSQAQGRRNPQQPEPGRGQRTHRGHRHHLADQPFPQAVADHIHHLPGPLLPLRRHQQHHAAAIDAGRGRQIKRGEHHHHGVAEDIDETAGEAAQLVHPRPVLALVHDALAPLLRQIADGLGHLLLQLAELRRHRGSHQPDAAADQQNQRHQHDGQRPAMGQTGRLPHIARQPLQQDGEQHPGEDQQQRVRHLP